jgi:DNA-binding response OmpR family regulator
VSQAQTRILCVDDDKETCMIVSLILGSRKYEVLSVETVAEALRAIQENHFGLLIVNHLLPDGSGLDLIRKVREGGLIMPIIVHSAAAHKEEIDEAIEAGADDYLIKPNGWAKLLETVEGLLHQGRLIQ